MFTSPVFLMGSAVATLWASLFHLLCGRRWQQLILFWFFALVGFALGQLLGDALQLGWLMFGQVHLLEGSLLCWLAMLIARAARL